MTLRQRVARYLLGLFIGSVVVFFMFPNYDWLGWTPNKTLMKQIRESRWEANERGQCMLSCTMTTNEQIQVIRSSGEINFSKSDAQATPKRYRVEYGEMGLDVFVTDTLITLFGIDSKTSAACACR
ncbi:MAG: hypothetical protein ACKVOK_13800 [Flavobacteriales bacterium]